MSSRDARCRASSCVTSPLTPRIQVNTHPCLPAPALDWRGKLHGPASPCFPLGGSDTVLLMERPALIVIDMLNDFLGNWQPARKESLIRSINELVDLIRSRGHSVIWIRQEFEADLSDAFLEMKAKGIRSTIKGTRGCQIISELHVAQTDAVIVKKRYSAFFGTTLDDALARLRPDAIILAGINTHACIRTTAVDAYQRDWPVILASDCIDSYDREHHEVSLRYMKDKVAAGMSNEEIRSALRRAG
jgi:maleamate amidohydrolase